MIATTKGDGFSYKYPEKNEKGDISYVTKSAGCHAVVSYGYKDSEFVCNFGWFGAGYGACIVNKNYIRAWRYIDIL